MVQESLPETGAGSASPPVALRPGTKPWAPSAPVRGTQSFVDTMGAVWRRPWLVLLEVAWRWIAGIPLLVLIAFQCKRLWPTEAVDAVALRNMTVFRPLEAFGTIAATTKAFATISLPTAGWLLPLFVLVWIAAWAWGRGLVLHRLNAGVQSGSSSRGPKAFGALLALRALRVFLLLLLTLCWTAGLRGAARITIMGPGSRSEEPNLVGFCALVICGSLLLYVGWAAVNWVLDAAPLLAMRGGTGARLALRQAWNLGPVRAKLVEINMVVSIVKIALLVLALVFSACPLPFESFASEEFLLIWWTAVALFYLVASDYFHVVRSAAYLALLREYRVDF